MYNNKHASTRDDITPNAIICMSSIDNSGIITIIITSICRIDNNVINRSKYEYKFL